MLQRAIKIRTQFEGIHCWPEAPEEVKFLRVPHRHMFGIRVEIEVNTNDRDIEFIMVKHVVDHWLGLQYDDTNNVWQMGRLSCEQVAEMVIDLVQQKFDKGKKRTIGCTVDEDGENEAIVQYIPDEDLLEQDEYIMNVSVPKKATDIVSLQDYQSKSYVAIQKHDGNKEEVMHWAIGLGEEAGEVLSVIKHKYYGGKYDIEDLVNELGDTLWHIAALCAACNIKLEDVAAYNLAKLNHRYPAGSFDNERSIKRRDVHKSFKDTEERRKLLEKILGNQ